MTSPAPAGDWLADPAACTLTFAVRNFGLRTVTGQIPLTSAVVQVGPDGQPAGVRAELDAAGIRTGNPRRDRDLRGPRFLATDQWPVITFEAGLIKPRKPAGRSAEPSPSRTPGARCCSRSLT